MPTLEEHDRSIRPRYDPGSDGPVFRHVVQRYRQAMPREFAAPGERKLPAQVDLSAHLYFIRKQGGVGCWGYSAMAVTDIMNEMACPFSPSLSMRAPMMLHRWADATWRPAGGLFTPDGRWYPTVVGPDGIAYITSKLGTEFGMTTEGTEPTLHYYGSWDPSRKGWSDEGVNEAANYRVASDWTAIAITSASFMNAIASGHPIRLGISGPGWGHFVAVVGYDTASQAFRIVDSGGDKDWQDGYYTYTFPEIDAKKSGSVSIDTAEIEEIVPPRPVPAARIRVEHTFRSNVHLWIGVEDSPLPRRKIWPHGWDDHSRNLHFTVRLPSEFIWPPTSSNRLILELYDAAEYSKSGGVLVEFTAAFGGHVISCPTLAAGAMAFKARERRIVTIP